MFKSYAWDVPHGMCPRSQGNPYLMSIHTWFRKHFRRHDRLLAEQASSWIAVMDQRQDAGSGYLAQ